MVELREKLFGQRSIGGWWGKFALASSQVVIFGTAYTILLVSINAYEHIYMWFALKGIQLKFYIYIIIVLLPVAIAYLVAWKFLVVSFYEATVEQFWRQLRVFVEQYLNESEVLKDKFEKIDRIDEFIKGEDK